MAADEPIEPLAAFHATVREQKRGIGRKGDEADSSGRCYILTMTVDPHDTKSVDDFLRSAQSIGMVGVQFVDKTGWDLPESNPGEEASEGEDELATLRRQYAEVLEESRNWGKDDASHAVS